MHDCKVLLACRWHVFEGRTIDARLEAAYDSFHHWCVAEKRKSSIKKFELKTFKMTSFLGANVSMHVLFTCDITTCMHTIDLL